jgi:hypothetical protein
MKHEMHRQWIAMEHYRLHSVETWPNSPYREAALAAIHSTLESLRQGPDSAQGVAECMVCAGEKKDSGVLDIGRASRPASKRTHLAA